ncbi:hypothetical protein ECE50_005340 [Chitinophaga sp. Mgbs1]|uniref:DUF6443 domain-containing protein n=1 Tax=Chitinophaga solisilvae TaxID=1233460 RepID=A0A9Q5GRH9_9BACT|nr:hypothetical protein [Chitinophaga solisilvae]
MTLSLFASAARSQNNPNNIKAPQAVTPDALPAAFNNDIRLNYIRTYIPSKPYTAATDLNMQVSVENVAIGTVYSDGMARPLQNVIRQASPDKKDIVTFNVYDEYGREAMKFLPYKAAGADGAFKQDVYEAARTFNTAMYPGEQVSYGKTYFDNSPLNRVLKVTAPGNSWAGSQRGMATKERANVIADSVRKWTISSPDISAIPVSAEIYGPNQLIVQEETDEQQQLLLKFIDQKGRVVLIKRKAAANAAAGHVGWISTYIIYDEINNLRFVITPKAVSMIMQNWTLNDAVIRKELCYQYQYDNQRRKVVQSIPGGGVTELVYDSRDRVVYSRKENTKDKGWLVTFHDAADRQVRTGFYNQQKTRAELQQAMDNLVIARQQGNKVVSQAGDLEVSQRDKSIRAYKAGNSIVFSTGFVTPDGDEMIAYIEPGSASETYMEAEVYNPTPPEANVEWLSYAYYDNYNWSGAASFNKTYTSRLSGTTNPQADPSLDQSNLIKGKMTGVRYKVLGTDQWLTTTIFYNSSGRPLQTVLDNIAGGKDITTVLYDFSGKQLSSYQVHSNPRSTLTPETRVLSVFTYDHAGRITEVRKRLNDDAAQERIVAKLEYNSLGQLRKKDLGVKADGNVMDSLVYDYNIRGWLSGINRNFVNTPNSTSNKFGEELSYDIGFDMPQYNGNVAGIKWKGWNDKIARAYGYRYDQLNQLTNADFKQQNAPGAAWTNDKMNFSVSELSYDNNGNILSMSQQGMKGTTSTLIDKLSYTYQPGSNKLQRVADGVNDPNSTLGDFKKDAGHTGTVDYDYDANGNLTKDLNKKIAQITYNLFDKPETLTVTGKGSIKYLYDAFGNKLRKIVTDNTASAPVVTVTDYIGNFVYRNDSLRMFGHEEGRIRPVYKTGGPVTLVYDYFERDHLSNVRAVLTEQTDYKVYAATMEQAAAPVETALFSNIDATRSALPAGYPEDRLTRQNESAAKLNARADGRKIGPSLVLRVTAGDTVQLSVRAFYKSGAPADKKNNALPEEMLAGLINNFNGTPGTTDIHAGPAETGAAPFGSKFTANDYRQLTQKDPDQPQQNKPRAYLNYVLFDGQFKMVDENSGVKRVQENPDQLQTLGTDKMPISKSGFLYVYTSNESQQDVYFDNMLLGVSLSPVMEETHYYPFGLEMAGISYNAGQVLKNNYRYNGGAEWEDELDVNLYSTFYRSYDPQIGRFSGVDIAASKASDYTPYQFAYNNPVRFNDPMGDEVTVREIIDNLFDSDNGGSWSNGNYYAFKSAGEAFNVGAAEISVMSLWGNSFGVAANYAAAASKYNGSEHAQSTQNFVPSKIVELKGVKVKFRDPASYKRAQQEILRQMDQSEAWNLSPLNTGNMILASAIASSGVTGELIEYGTRSSGITAITTAQYYGKEAAALSKGISVAGKAAFGVQIVVSGLNVVNAYKTNNKNKRMVALKGALDITIGAVSTFGGPIGLAIGGIYLLADAGHLMDWGLPAE